MWDRLAALVADLRRRKVFQAVSLYVVAAWGAALGVSELSQTFAIDPALVRNFVTGLVLLLPVVAGLAWYFDITRLGIVRDRQALTSRGPSSSVQVAWESPTGAKSSIFDDAFLIGRDARCEVHTLEPVASRQHARIEMREGAWWLVDLDSSNGTYLDGARVKRARLAGDACVMLGETGVELKIRVLDQGAATVTLPHER